MTHWASPERSDLLTEQPDLTYKLDLSALTSSLSTTWLLYKLKTLLTGAKRREQLSQQLTSIKCTTLAPSKCSCSQGLLTVVPSTKGWRHQFGGRSWLFRLQLRGKLIVGLHSLVLLFCGYTTIQLAESRILQYRLYIVAENIQPSIFGSIISRNISENPNWVAYKSSLVFNSYFLILLYFAWITLVYRSCCLPACS